jgi:hypothetical protein
VGFGILRLSGRQDQCELPCPLSTSTYVVEMSYVQNMIGHAITRETFKPGDEVTVKMNPLRDGRPGGSYVTVSKDAGSSAAGRSNSAVGSRACDPLAKRGPAGT